MKAELGAGYAASTQPRRKLLPRLSRRANVVVAAAGVLAFAWLSISEIRAQIRLAPLRATLSCLTEAKVARWERDEPRARPVARLLKSLTWWQMWRMGHDKNCSLGYTALMPFQQSLFLEACEIERRRAERRTAFEAAPATVPMYLRLTRPSRPVGRKDLVYIAGAYTTAELHGFVGGSVLALHLGKEGKDGTEGE